MPLATSREAAAKTARRYEGTGGYKWRTRSMYFGVGKEEAKGSLEPQAFLIEIEPPGGFIRPHFHESKQFQVFIGGDGTLARHHSIRPLVVHYSDAFTTYGPIVTETCGSSFFTLRHKHDSGAQYMPDSRDKERGIPGKPGRNRSVRTPEAFSAGPLPANGDVHAVEMMAEDIDGLGTWAYRAGPDTVISGPDPASGDGAYWLVIDGTVLHEGEELDRHSLIYVHPDEAPLNVRSGASGAYVICMQFGELDILRGG